MTLARVFQGLEQTSDEARLGRNIDHETPEFGNCSYLEQEARLQQTMDAFKVRVQPEELSAKSAAASPKVTALIEAEPVTPSTTEQQFRPALTPGSNPITTDAYIVRVKRDQVDRGQLQN